MYESSKIDFYLILFTRKCEVVILQKLFSIFFFSRYFFVQNTVPSSKNFFVDHDFKLTYFLLIPFGRI
jgi:hypothetical protein